MKVLVLTTSGRVDNAELAAVRAPFEERGQRPRVTVVGLHRPRGRVRAWRYLVVGPSLRPRRALRDVEVRGHRKGPVLTGPGAVGQRVDRLIGRLVPRRWSRDNALRLATGCAWSPVVRRAFAAADYVVVLDWNATWAAWLLARRLEGPQVVFLVDGARLKLSELDALAELRP